MVSYRQTWGQSKSFFESNTVQLVHYQNGYVLSTKSHGWHLIRRGFNKKSHLWWYVCILRVPRSHSKNALAVIILWWYYPWFEECFWLAWRFEDKAPWWFFCFQRGLSLEMIALTPFLMIKWLSVWLDFFGQTTESFFNQIFASWNSHDNQVRPAAILSPFLEMPPPPVRRRSEIVPARTFR